MSRLRPVNQARWARFRHNRQRLLVVMDFPRLVWFELVLLNLSPTINRCWCVMTAVGISRY